MNPLVEEKNVSGVDVYIFENHAYALYAWASISKKLGASPIVLTIDHHTDTKPAFFSYSYNKPTACDASRRSLVKLLCGGISKTDPDNLQPYIEKLRHDEHIDASIKSGVIDFAYVVSFMGQDGSLSNEQIEFKNRDRGPITLESLNNPEPPPSPPFTYSIPENRIFVSSSRHIFNIEECVDGDEALRKSYDMAIEGNLLRHRLDQLKEMSDSSGAKWIDHHPYVLDIDLDYFHTAKSVAPDDIGLFYELIQGAAAITIAKETKCVEDLREEGEEINSDILLSNVIAHITSARI
jgi:hypothetical protein